MRPQRRRFFGHPLLVRYLQELGAATDQKGLGVLLIGDLGQPRGGPMPFGHRSHQIGLDVDIWFWLPGDGMVLSVAERESIGAPSMLTADGRALDGQQWLPQQAEVLRLAVGFDVVARIFVNPVIKKALCEQFPAVSWLQKLRPWWGHDDHFHVRCAVRWGRPHVRIRTHFPPAVAVALSLPGGSPKKHASPHHRWILRKFRCPLPVRPSCGNRDELTQQHPCLSIVPSTSARGV